MQRRLLFVFLGALIIAGAAGYTVYRLTGNQPLTLRSAPATQIVVAARDLEAGTLIRDSDLKMADWAGSLPAGATTRKESAVNRGVASAIYRGEPVTGNRLAPAGSGGGLAATIPPGMRACAVKVNEVVGVAGFVIPGMRVDILITGVPPGEPTGGGPAVKTLLQNIRVLSAGERIDNDGKPQQAQVVNLLVDPRQAEILSLAGNETRIQLVLRNPADTEVTMPPGASMSELFGAPKAPPPAPARASSPAPARAVAAPRAAERTPAAETVEVLNGSTHTMARFRNAEERRP